MTYCYGARFSAATEETPMNLYTGMAMLAVAFLLIWLGRPNKAGIHRKFLRFNAALVLYPPLILSCFAFGVAAIISSGRGSKAGDIQFSERQWRRAS